MRYRKCYGAVRIGDLERGIIMGSKKLYRSRKEKMICGVCGGIAEYFNIDPTIIRLAWVLVALTGSGILVYLAAAIIIPDEPEV